MKVKEKAEKTKQRGMRVNAYPYPSQSIEKRGTDLIYHHVSVLNIGSFTSGR